MTDLVPLSLLLPPVLFPPLHFIPSPSPHPPPPPTITLPTQITSGWQNPQKNDVIN